MIIVADAHISRIRKNHHAFFDMLAAVEKTDHEIVFLGDIFDLWVALPGYEDDLHGAFVSWCRRRKKVQGVGFMEGNHEFFLADQRSRDFTWCSQAPWRRGEDGTLFVHGDRINRRDKKYLVFRGVTKSSLARWILQNLPCGPPVTAFIRKRLERSGNVHRTTIPWNAIEAFAQSRFAEGAATVFVGHFHREYRLGGEASKALYMLPDWSGTQKIAVYQKHPRKIQMMHWKALAADC
jgi:UDP-2,3-diacylglucosamine pyrophosphatase LpxH